ncbi:M23 family metallopeptidase [Symbiobacterium thermophilum]|uniref:M23 family metallopeptidase n=1 Tax=Symbiobacterium thermophilum TaxID=2734 RepID=UPI000323FFF7|nr:M23 family metallopeptidase [Symbiobacterium thermophilum]
MPRRAGRVQLIVVPSTNRRSYSFFVYPALLAAGLGLVVLVVAALALGLRFFQTEAARLRAELAEMEALKQQARLQQEELERMRATAEQVEQELQEIRRLEKDLEHMTEGEDTLPSRSALTRRTPPGEGARGGPETSHSQQVPGLTLASILPDDVSPFVLGKRNTLAMDLKLGRLPSSMDSSLQSSRAVRAQLARQLAQLRDSVRALADGRDQLAAKLDYLAHKPAGWPVYGAEITDPFGPRWSPFGYGWQFHDGIDLGQDYGTPVYATGAGTVVYADWLEGGYGRCVIIDHGYGYRTLYAHLQDWNVFEGQEVERGDLIGWVGSSGLSTGPHLHYEVLVNGVAVDPEPYLESRPEE